ncbi:phosphatidylinositol alpha-mannosyltransferase [Pseudonocardia thermophila]|uniref:Phosphatidylinositol alpha-mannosyltransferase n=1 Tax=Pseudonocardia thermophila TaxID=1848 RepID=A0A1M6Z380_PSETH|nr:phosphatidylinositol alpha-mannosyltransferase [Pseudonocardia thermophila]
MTGALRIGLVCPYSLDVPGGVQAHVLGLANALRELGHEAAVLAPGAGPVPDFVTSAGRALGLPYNGSVARVAFGPLSYARVRRWLAEHRFDVLHLHEPTTLSLSALALTLADGPVVATFHTATDRSRALRALVGVAQPLMERVTARIAVSATARRVQVEHLGGDAVEIPNGVDVAGLATAEPLDVPRPTIGFLGRFEEPRKGMPVLLDACRRLARTRPDVRLLVVGPGDPAALADAGVPVTALGAVDDATKARALRAMDVFCAPNLGGESFGMVLTEAMAAGAPVVASDLDGFAAVLAGNGVLVPPGDAAALASALDDLLGDPARRAALAEAGRARAAAFAWPTVAARVVQVYRAAIAADPRRLREAS